MYGSTRVSLIDKAVHTASYAARVGRLVVRLATRPRWRLTDLYAAIATARFMAAHELINQAAELTADDPDADLIQIRQPLWFGAGTIHEEN
ncbi:hypothetical protein [Streptomyces sp. NPDC050355]|uniref:hypothetical protein n=1 Tax=Streptomyces sp. NPDC050355 TaxID=3365609 RepID=UPI00379F2FCD